MTRKSPKLIVVLLLLIAFAGLVLAAKTCPNCGTDNRDDARFCKSCGYRFEVRRPAPARRSLIRTQVSVVQGVLEVSSTPTGARVKIDGEHRGTTSLSVRNLRPGQHSLEVSRTGYRTYYGVFVIPELKGRIVVTTVPAGAEVLLDSESTGIAGDSGLSIEDVPLGVHVLVARLSGYEDGVDTVELTAEQPVLEIVLRLELWKGFLRVDSRPDGAALAVNRSRVGLTSYFGTLAPARYELSLSKPGFTDWLGHVEVQPAETTFVLATLRRLRTRKPAFLWVGLVSLAGGGAAAVMGQLDYSKYQQASTPGDAERLRNSTEIWDLARNIAAGVGTLSIGAYLLF